MMTFHDSDELPHRGTALIDEWIFAAWGPDPLTGRLTGCLSGHRLTSDHAWYWSAVVQDGEPLLELTEWEVPLRRDLFVVKAPEMWAEHHCVEPMQQWSIGNEGHFVALDDPEEALGRAYGTPTPVSFDLEWYATERVQVLATTSDEATGITHAGSFNGYTQAGVVHGRIELLTGPVDWAEVPACRWRRWTSDDTLPPVSLTEVIAHTGLRAPFRFPGGAVSDWVLTPGGFRERWAPGRASAVPTSAT